MADCDACGRPVPDVAYVCHPCAYRDDRQPPGLGPRLHHAADLWPDLLDTVAGQARMTEPGPHRRGNSPPQPIRPGLGDPVDDHQLGQPTGLPFSWNASIVQEDVQAEVDSWVRLVAEERYGDRPPHGPICLECEHPTCERIHAWRRWMPPPADIPEAMRWLAAQLGWARYQRWAGEMWQALEPLHRWIENAVDRPAMRVRVAVGPCPEAACSGQVTAYVPHQQDRPAVMRCDTCSAEWSTQQWARVGRRILARMAAA